MQIIWTTTIVFFFIIHTFIPKHCDRFLCYGKGQIIFSTNWLSTVGISCSKFSMWENSHLMNESSSLAVKGENLYALPNLEKLEKWIPLGNKSTLLQ